MSWGGERTPFDRHHVLWTRREQQKTRINRALRNHPGFIIPLPVTVHRDLHAEVGPPIVPSPAMAESLLGAVSGARINDIFSVAIKHLVAVTEADTALSPQAQELGFNFLNQAEIMSQVYRFDFDDKI